MTTVTTTKPTIPTTRRARRESERGGNMVLAVQVVLSSLLLLLLLLTTTTPCSAVIIDDDESSSSIKSRIRRRKTTTTTTPTTRRRDDTTTTTITTIDDDDSSSSQNKKKKTKVLNAILQLEENVMTSEHTRPKEQQPKTIKEDSRVSSYDELKQFEHCNNEIQEEEASSSLQPAAVNLEYFRPSASTPLRRIWIPGYPGSGSELLVTLIHEMTGGMIADNIYFPSRCVDVPNTISCKTHYPASGSISGSWVNMTEEQLDLFDPNYYMMLLRNPAHAIPSNYNHLHEWKSGNAGDYLQTSHSIQAPVDDWRRFRNKLFDINMKRWVHIIQKWIMNTQDGGSPYEPALFIPYEELIDMKTGPKLLQEMAKQFVQLQQKQKVDQQQQQQENDGNVVNLLDSLIDTDAISCLWKNLVLDHPSKKRISTYQPGYTIQQQQYMLQSILKLQDWIQRKQQQQQFVQQKSDDELIIMKKNDSVVTMAYEKLIQILDGYYIDIQNNLIIDDEH